MIYIGDCHGKTQKLHHMLYGEQFFGKKAFQLGDMGLGFQGVTLRKFETKWFQFIRGNHDNPAWCREHPNYAGDFGYDEAEKLFFLGGAWSIDAAWRTEGSSWWRDEELSLAELDAAFQLYTKVKPEIVATHEAPSKAAWSMLAALTGNVPHSEYLATDQEVRAKGSDYAYYKEKLGCVNTRTSGALQRMFEEHQPKYWVFGHYHLDKSFKIGGTEFQCLNELSTREIELGKDSPSESSQTSTSSTSTDTSKEPT